MIVGDDDVYAATAHEADRTRQSECDELRRTLLALEQQHRLLTEQHVNLTSTCENRLAALQWIADQADADRQVTLDQVIKRVRSTLDS